MIFRNWLLALVAGLVLLAVPPAFAEVPGWHSGEVSDIFVRGTYAAVAFDPSISDQCGGNGFAELRTISDNETNRVFRERALMLLAGAQSNNGQVSVYLTERVASNGSRSCRVVSVQRPRPPDVASAILDLAAAIREGNGNNNDGNDDGNGNNGGNVQRSGYIVASYSPDRTRLYVGMGFNYTSSDAARSAGLERCRSETSYEHADTCVIRMIFRSCAAYAESSSRRSAGWASHGNLARARENAVQACDEHATRNGQPRDCRVLAGSNGSPFAACNSSRAGQSGAELFAISTR